MTWGLPESLCAAEYISAALPSSRLRCVSGWRPYFNTVSSGISNKRCDELGVSGAEPRFTQVTCRNAWSRGVRTKTDIVQ